jgi:hypothetical protein
MADNLEKHVGYKRKEPESDNPKETINDFYSSSKRRKTHESLQLEIKNPKKWKPCGFCITLYGDANHSRSR